MITLFTILQASEGETQFKVGDEVAAMFDTAGQWEWGGG